MGGAGRWMSALTPKERTDCALDSFDRWIRSMDGTAEHEPMHLEQDFVELKRRLLILGNRINEENQAA